MFYLTSLERCINYYYSSYKYYYSMYMCKLWTRTFKYNSLSRKYLNVRVVLVSNLAQLGEKWCRAWVGKPRRHDRPHQITLHTTKLPNNTELFFIILKTNLKWNPFNVACCGFGIWFHIFVIKTNTVYWFKHSDDFVALQSLMVVHFQ